MGFRPLRILDACNPVLARWALEAEPGLGARDPEHRGLRALLESPADGRDHQILQPATA